MTSGDVQVTCAPDDDGFRCDVVVGTDSGATHHEVTVSAADLAGLAPDNTDPAALVAASFAFLLERESRESILARFALPVIGRYYPEYATTIRDRLAKRAP